MSKEGFLKALSAGILDKTKDLRRLKRHSRAMGNVCFFLFEKAEDTQDPIYIDAYERMESRLQIQDEDRDALQAEIDELKQHYKEHSR